MTNIADKTETTAPATNPTESGTPETPAKDGQVTEPAPELDATALQTQLEAEREKRIQSERNYAHLQSKFGEQGQEVATLRALRDAAFGGQGEEEAPGQASRANAGNENGLEEVVRKNSEELAWMKFRQQHPKYGEYWDDMKKVATDPEHRSTIESYQVVNGRPMLNHFATLHNAYLEVENQRFRSAQRDDGQRRAEAEAQTKKIKAQATISGSGAGSGEVSGKKRIEDLSYEELMATPYNELIKLVPTDPNDPPLGI